jgi:hypothetical protein
MEGWLWVFGGLLNTLNIYHFSVIDIVLEPLILRFFNNKENRMLCIYWIG